MLRDPGSEYDDPVTRIAELNTDGLIQLIRHQDLDDSEVLEVLRSPFCTVRVAEAVLERRSLLGSHLVRERLAQLPGVSLATAMALLATLPWLSLLHTAKQPRTPPLVRRHAERKLLQLMGRLSLGEAIALSRLAHRPLIRSLGTVSRVEVQIALLDNPHVVENDILEMMARSKTPRALVVAILGHRRWGLGYGVRLAGAVHPNTPIPLALSALVQLKQTDLNEISTRLDVADVVRAAAASLLERGKRGGTIPR